MQDLQPGIRLIEAEKGATIGDWSQLNSMPRVSEFYGIVIAMYFNDHPPPHFHAKYQEHEATFSIEALAMLEGQLPRRSLALVLEWANLHREELLDNWDRARRGTALRRIEPLD
jgi:hypothetical protein